MSSAAFTALAADAAAEPGAAYFYARGSAAKGDLVVARNGEPKTYTVSVEGLTGRVSSNTD